MKMMAPIVLTVLVGVGTIPYVYGFKKAFSENPFIFAGWCNLFCGIVLLVISYSYAGIEQQYFAHNWKPIVMAALGIVVANAANYFIITRFGASYWLLSSLAMLLIPSFVVGYLIFKEHCNLWIAPCLICALLTVLFFGLSKQ